MINKKFNAALIQLNSSCNVEENLSAITSFVREASEKAQLIILPEHSDAVGKNEADFAHPLPGEISRFFSSLAKKYSVFLHCGSLTELGKDNKIYNTSVIFSPEGKIVSTYRKLHLFDVELPNATDCRESDKITPGNEIIVADTPLCKIGLSICYDLRFPELYRSMALSGADIMAVSSNFTAQTGQIHWKPLLQARAIENGCYVAGVNQCGQKPQFEAFGHSMLIDPWGNIIAELEQEPGIVFGEINSEILLKTRRKIPSLLNRRSDIY